MDESVPKHRRVYAALRHDILLGNTLLERIRHPKAPPRQILLNPELGTTVKATRIVT